MRCKHQEFLLINLRDDPRRFHKIVEDYKTRLEEIQQMKNLQNNLYKERAVRGNIEIMKKKIFVQDKNRRWVRDELCEFYFIF